MWKPSEATYNEQAVFGVAPSVKLRQRLLRSNPALELSGALYAAVCVLDEGLRPLPEGALPPHSAGGHDAYKVFAECFDEDAAFGYARAGRTLVFVIRSGEAMDASCEDAFLRYAIRGATAFVSAMEAELETSITLSVGPVFDRLEDCEHAACDALIMADFIRFIEVPVAVVDEKYYAGMKQIIKKQYPDYKLDNYERPMISAMLNGNISHAELIANNLLTAHLVDPLFIFPTLRTAMVNTVRMCMSMVCPDPRALADGDPRLPQIHKAMRDCASVSRMRVHLHAHFEIMEEYLRRSAKDAALNDKVQKIVDYINDRGHDPLLGATMICDEFGISASYFSRIFKERMGVNFSVYLQTLRVTRAKALILDTELTIDAIAQQVGCLNGQNLFRLFKKFEGVSPSAYKSLARGEAPQAEE